MATKYKYNEPFDNSNGGTVIVKNGNLLGYGANEGQSIVLEEHYFWGQPYNGQQDVNGDINIDKGDVISGCGDIHMKGVFNNEWSLGGNITADNHTKTKTLEVEDKADIGASLNVGENVNVGYNVSAKTGTFSDSVDTQEIYAKNGYIDNIEAKDIKTHNLTVTGLAHFFELTIDKISASGGAVIYSPADGFETERVVHQIKMFTDSGTKWYDVNLPMNYYVVDSKTQNSGFSTDYFLHINNKTSSVNITNTKICIKVKRYGSDELFYYFPFTDELYSVYEMLKFIYPSTWENVDNVKLGDYNGYSYVYGANNNNNNKLSSLERANYFYSNPLNIVYEYKVTDEYTGEYDPELKLWPEQESEFELKDKKVYTMRIMEPDVDGNYHVYQTEDGLYCEMNYCIVTKISTNEKYIWDMGGLCKLMNTFGLSNFDVENQSFVKLEGFDFKNHKIMQEIHGYVDSSNNYYSIDNNTIHLKHRYWIRKYTAGSSPFSSNNDTCNTKVGSYLLWRVDDGDKARKNMWQNGDQAICRNFNQAKVGTSQNVSNKYYWGLVQKIGEYTGACYIRMGTNGNVFFDENENIADYHYIFIGTDDLDGELNAEPGDEIAMLGNRTNEDRQNAIYISAYSSMDTTLKPPFLAQYAKINNYSLDGKKTTWFAKNGNRIVGDLVIESSGKSVEDVLDDNIDKIKEKLHIKVLPAKPPKVMSYDDWQQQIGLELAWTTPIGEDVEEFKVGGVRRNNTSTIYDVEDGLYVLIENEATHKYSYNDKRYLEDTRSKITVYGQIKSYNPIRDGSCVWTVEVKHILDGDLENVWSSMAMIRVTQDGITLKVQDLDKGIAQLQLRADSIQSSVTNLETNMNSKLTQTAEELRFEINEVAKLIVDDNNITLNENTIVNGNVTIPEPYEFDMVAKEGITHLQSKSIGNLVDFYGGTHIEKTLSFTKTVSIPDWQAGTGTNGQNTMNIWVYYSEDFTITAKTDNWIISLSNHSCQASFTNPNNNLLVGGRDYAGGYYITLFNQSGSELFTVEWSSLQGKWTYTIPNSGTYKLRIKQNVGLAYKDSNRDKIPDNKYAGGAKLTGTTNIVLTEPKVEGDNGTIQAKSCLGPDGYSANFGNGGVIWMAKDQTSLNYGPYELCIKPDGIFKRCPDSDGVSGIRDSYNADKLIRLKDVIIEKGTTVNDKTECICPGTNITLPTATNGAKSGTRVIVMGGYYNGSTNSGSATVVTYYFRGRERTVTVNDGELKTFIFSSGGWWHD